MKALTEVEIAAFVDGHPNWQFIDGVLTREWKFPDFVTAMSFVNRVAQLAEEAQHHPDIDIRYNRVKLALVSHDAGGITARDARMSERLNSLVL